MVSESIIYSMFCLLYVKSQVILWQKYKIYEITISANLCNHRFALEQNNNSSCENGNWSLNSIVLTLGIGHGVDF